MEQLDYNLLFRWFVVLRKDDRIWDAMMFSKNRERLLDGDIPEALFEMVLAAEKSRWFLSGKHFKVDGTRIEAWAGKNSFRRKDGKWSGGPEGTDDDPGNPTVDFHGERRANATHASTTDPEARLYQKTRGSEAKLSRLGHVLMENRNGLTVRTRSTQATGTVDRDAALEMAEKILGI